MADSFTSNEPETGVFSLTQIRHLMRVEFGRAQRYGYPVACLVLACDGLAQLRDRHGYEFRETVLGEVVRLLHQSSRACDYLGRLMDDRLMAILPHTTKEGGERAAERMLEAARSLALRSQGERVPVTLSVGVSHFHDDNTMFFDSLVEAAEDAMREALAAGGDRYFHRDPGPTT